MQQVTDLKTHLANLEVDATSFYEKDNKAAARRARKSLQEIKKICSVFRKDISERVNGLKVQQ